MNDERINNAADKVKKKAVKKAKGKAKRKVKSKAKKISVLSYIVWAIALILGVAAGAFACAFICRNDCFELKGKSEYVIELGDEGSSTTFVDKGATVVSMGKDISRKVKVSTNLKEVGDGEYLIDTSKEGTYYIVYSVDDERFADVKRVRTFKVGGND